MLDKFNAQSLVETNATGDRTAFELTFVDAKGARHTLRLSRGVAKDLVPVLQSLTESKEVTGDTALTLRHRSGRCPLVVARRASAKRDGLAP